MPILHRVGHGRIRQCRDTPATAAPASRCAAAVRHGYGSSPAAASRVRVVVGRREQLAFQGRVVELRGFRPGDADHRRATMYSAIAVRPMPSDRENTRALAPHGYFRRRTSGIFCIDNPSAALAPPPCANRKGRTLPPQIEAVFSASPYQQGGRFPSESVTAFPRIPHASPCARGPL